jgi:hypothetical protein
MSRLKITDEHVRALRAGVSPFLNHATSKVYTEAGLSAMRYRWDALWSACKYVEGFNDLISEIYRYANDDHIDTVLRMVAKERESVEEHRAAIGICEFRRGGTVITSVPVYSGEDLTDASVMERARRTADILNVTMAGMLLGAESRFIPLMRGGK